MTQLRRHLDRVKWRDKEAAQTYYTLVQAQPVMHYVLTDYDRVLKDYYNDDTLKRMSYLSNPFTEMLRKEGRKLNQYVYCVPMEECPRDRAYMIGGLHDWLPVKASYEDIGKSIDERNIEKYGSPFPPEAVESKPEEAMPIEHIERDVPIRTKSPSKEYRDGWDRIFGEKKEETPKIQDIEVNCPACGERHYDVGEWFDRPHRTHLCLKCGQTWRPSDEYTRGV